jgi:hypothetical protein
MPITKQKMLIVSAGPATAEILGSHISPDIQVVHESAPRRALVAIGTNTDIRSLCIVSDGPLCPLLDRAVSLAITHGKRVMQMPSSGDNWAEFLEFASA